MFKGLKNFLILAVFITISAVGMQIFGADASGTSAEIFNMGKQLVKVAAVLILPLGIYFIAKDLT